MGDTIPLEQKHGRHADPCCWDVRPRVDRTDEAMASGSERLIQQCSYVKPNAARVRRGRGHSLWSGLCNSGPSP